MAWDSVDSTWETGAPAAAGFVPEWIQLRVADAELGDASAPGFAGTAAPFNALTEDAAGWQISLDNVISADSLKAGCSWRFPIAPDFVDDGTWGFAVRVTEVTPFPDNKSAWITVGWADRGGVMTDASVLSLSAGITRIGTNNRATGYDSALRLVGGENAFTVMTAILHRWNPEDQVILAVGRSGLPAIVSSVTILRNETLFSGERKLIVSAGCQSTLADGPHTGKFKLEYAVIPVFPAGTF